MRIINKLIILAGIIVLINGCTTTTTLQEKIVAPPCFETRPEPVLIPETNVYYIPQSTLFSYYDKWYYHHADLWFCSRNYNGPWTRISTNYLPAELKRIPPSYLKAHSPDKK